MTALYEVDAETKKRSISAFQEEFNCPLFYSQQGEDYFVYQYFINQVVDDGIFVELGALDGFLYSNTKYFEDYGHFKGVLIEPVHRSFSILEGIREVSDCYNYAISETGEPVEFEGEWAEAGVSDGNSRGSYFVESRPISDILHQSNISYIDFLSIDVEGSEETVLNTMDWDIDVYLICIELDGINATKDEACRKILRKNGFQLEQRMCINEFWRNPNYYRKDLLYRKPDDLGKDIDPTIQLAGLTLKLQKNQKVLIGHSGYGVFLFLAPHCIDDINKAVKEYGEKNMSKYSKIK